MGPVTEICNINYEKTKMCFEHNISDIILESTVQNMYL